MTYAFLRVCAAVAVVLGGVTSAFAIDPGTVPGNRGGFKERPKTLPESASGLKPFYLKFGRYRVSVSAKGSNDASHKIRVNKPHKDALVDKAYLMAASNFSTVINNGDITLDGKPVTWSNSIFNAIPGFSDTFFNNVLADVTSILKAKINAMPAAGNKDFVIVENAGKNTAIDGEILVVVFKMPADFTPETVALMFGAQQLAGDRFELSLLNPIDPAKPNAVLNMGLGISFSCQNPSGCGSAGQQYTTVTVNGQRLTTSAGGEDDGATANGALITVGGLGDSPNRPANPNATPTSPTSDDERYSLLKFITKTDKVINVDTLNPSNDDNVLFAWFEFSGRGDVNKDTDGDGLLDSWETSGYDHDGDGTIDVNLPALGANKNKKDLFIAYAYMNKCAGETKTHIPGAAVLNPITQAFARAPVSNPDGTKGIKVHWKNLGMIPCTENLDLTAQNWAPFDTIMDAKVTEAQRKIYHRVIMGRKYDGGNSSGLSRGIGASDFVETLHSDATAAERAGTIMHELGHNLGLRHGGVDHENYKPNHLSIMSYSNQFDWLIKGGAPYLDYERFDLGDLNENALNEAQGLNATGAGAEAALAGYGVRWWTAGVGRVKNSNANANVNWNNTAPGNQPSVAVDINNGDGNPDNKSTLAAHYVEWDNLIFDGGQIGAGKKAREHRTVPVPPEALRELSLEEHRRKKESMKEVQ
jgi:hypothetical protein